jgi:hypothetical protein
LRVLQARWAKRSCAGPLLLLLFFVFVARLSMLGPLGSFTDIC